MSTAASLATVNGRVADVGVFNRCNSDYLISVSDGCTCNYCILPVFSMSATAQSSNSA